MGREAGDKLKKADKHKESLKHRLVRWLGLGNQSEFENHYLVSSNARAIVYMAGIVLFITVLLSLRLVYNYFVDNEITNADLILQVCLYVLLVVTCILSISFSMKHYRPDLSRIKDVSYSMVIIFSVACLLFGFTNSIVEYKTNGQILTFIAMELIVICILAWRPFVSISIVVGTFALFYLAIMLEDRTALSVSFTIVPPGVKMKWPCQGFTFLEKSNIR